MREDGGIVTTRIFERVAKDRVEFRRPGIDLLRDPPDRPVVEMQPHRVDANLAKQSRPDDLAEEPTLDDLLDLFGPPAGPLRDGPPRMIGHVERGVDAVIGREADGLRDEFRRSGPGKTFAIDHRAITLPLETPP